MPPVLHRAAGCDPRHRRVGRARGASAAAGRARARVGRRDPRGGAGLPLRQGRRRPRRARPVDARRLARLAGGRQPIANKEFLVNVFSSLGDNRREALKIAAGSAARRRSTPAWRRSRRSRRSCRGCRARAAWSSRGVPRALLLGPARLRQLSASGVAARAASMSAIACAVSRNQTGVILSSRATSQLISRSSTNRQSAPSSPRRSSVSS